MARPRLSGHFPALRPAFGLSLRDLGLTLSLGVLLSGCASQDWRHETQKVDATSATS